jgi:hypothetical protein
MPPMKKMKFWSLTVCSLVLLGCATPPTRFANASFTVDVPPGWMPPEATQDSGVASLSLTKEQSKTAFVRVRLDRFVTSERPALEKLIADLEETAGLTAVTDRRAIGEVLDLKGTGLQANAVLKSDKTRKFSFMVFLPRADSRLPNCSLTVVSTNITAETNVDQVLGSLRLAAP